MPIAETSPRLCLPSSNCKLGETKNAAGAMEIPRLHLPGRVDVFLLHSASLPEVSVDDVCQLVIVVVIPRCALKA